MTSQGDVKKSSGIRLWVLLSILGALVLIMAFAIGGRRRESARMAGARFVPGAGIIDAETGDMLAASAEDKLVRAPAAGRRRAGMRGGGAGPAGLSELPAATAAEGFASVPVSRLPSEAMLIRTAALRLRVEDVPKAHEQVAQIAREAEGYVASTTLSAEAGPTSAILTIRVPAEGLDSVIDRIAALGRLLRKEISTQEVTEEYVDLTSRRRNLMREEERLLDLLKRAGKVKDLLEVEQTLARVRGQIETIAGRMRYLENRVALSTVRVQLQGPEPEPTVGGPVWAAKDVVRQATRSLLGTGRGLATMAIWIGIYVPVWLPILLVLVWLIRRAARPPRSAETNAGS